MKILSVLVALFLLQACKHPLAIEGKGDIEERLIGHRGCTLEEFEASSPRCTENDVVDEDYIVSYKAVPRPSWKFIAWRGGTPCSADSVKRYCDYNVPEALVDSIEESAPGIELPATVAVFAQPNTWSYKADILRGRSGAGACVVNGKIYIIGGEDVAGEGSIARVDEYNPATDTWTRKANMPTARRFPAVSVVKGECYVIGGGLVFGEAALVTVEVFNPKKNRWRSKADLPTARTGAGSIVTGGKIYVIGGADIVSPSPNTVPTVAIYDPSSNTWMDGADVPSSRSGYAVAKVGTKIYLVGGSGSQGNGAVDVYNLETGKLTSKASMLTSRGGFGLNVVNENIYATGGTVGPSPVNTVERYNPQTNSWVARASMAENRWIFGSAVVDNQIFVFSGSDETGFDHISLLTTEVYTP